MKIRVKAYVFDVRFEKDFQTDIYERGVNLLNRNNIRRPHLDSQKPVEL